MRRPLFLAGILASVLFAAACGTGGSSTSEGAGGAGGQVTGSGGASGDGSTGGGSQASSQHAASHGHGPSTQASTGTGGSGVTNIKHVVVIVQENHSFDAYFGNYCQAPAYSDPTCTSGPSCCEGAPFTDPSGTSPTVLDDSENGDYDPDHHQACELDEMDSGLMDQFTSGASCSDPRNFAIAPSDVIQPYLDYASNYALADRYFQPIAGQSSSNDMYLAVARWVFTDNAYKPSTVGQGCTIPNSEITYTGTTIADVVLDAGHTFGVYMDGYQAMIDSFTCPSLPSDCTYWTWPISPCAYDPSDVPFQYFQQFADNGSYMFDLDQLWTDLANDTLPDFVYVKGTSYHNEHPGYGTTLSFGVDFTTTIVDAVLASDYGSDTLVLLTWDEGGGFFDHVQPPPASTIDNQPYGTRVPLLAIGRFAKNGHVSHVEMEHSSIVKFLEYNFTGETGQLGGRDLEVANIGSLLDQSQTGITIPSN